MDLLLALPADVAAHVGVELDSYPFAAVATGAEPSSDAAAAEDGDSDDPSALASIISLLPLVLIGLAVYFMLIRPTRRRQREQAEVSRSVEVGDEVVLTSGVVGFISAKDDDVYWVEIDDDVQVRVLPGAVSRKFVASATTDAGTTGAPPPADADTPPAKPAVKGRGRPGPGGGQGNGEAATEIDTTA